MGQQTGDQRRQQRHPVGPNRRQRAQQPSLRQTHLIVFHNLFLYKRSICTKSPCASRRTTRHESLKRMVFIACRSAAPPGARRARLHKKNPVEAPAFIVYQKTPKLQGAVRLPGRDPREPGHRARKKRTPGGCAFFIGSGLSRARIPPPASGRRAWSGGSGPRRRSRRCGHSRARRNRHWGPGAARTSWPARQRPWRRAPGSS